MEIKSVIKKAGLPPALAEVLIENGITKLYPPQEEAIKKGGLEKNLVLAIPTASGKTLVAELCMLRSILRNGGKCIYIVPLRALASEKYEEFKRKYSPLGVRVGMSTGDFDTADPALASYDILVATSEKVDSLLRHRARWLAEVVSVVVIDEIHLINDPGRGPTLEVLTARLRQVNPKVQIVALSATISNSEELAGWLDAELVVSDWRPVPLRKGVYWKGRIEFDDGSGTKVEEEVDELSSLALQTVRDGGQVLIFVNARRSAQSVASLLAKHVKKCLKREELEALTKLAEEVKGVLGEPTKTCKELALAISCGAAFHHAGLHHLQRKAIEDAFRKNLLKVVCATPTLAAGVNLPARRVIIRDYRRYVEPFGMQFIPVLEFHQMAGRAGRPGYDSFGEAVAISHGKKETRALFENFIQAEPERIKSRLAAEPALRSHILASIASGYVRDEDSMMEFLGETFFSYQFGREGVRNVVDAVLDFLIREKMVEEKAGLLTPTLFGEKVSMLYIDPLSGVVLRDGLENTVSAEPTTLGLLHLICHTPDMPTIYLGEGDREEVYPSFREHGDDFLVPVPDPDREPEKFQLFLAELKTALMLQSWIDEAWEDEIHDRFGVGAGDIRRIAETAEWLFYSAHELASLFKRRKALPLLRKLRLRMRNGVKEELLELVQLKGIGRVRGRSLFKAGFRTLDDIRSATEERLAQIPYIGREIARSIKRQV